MTSLFEILVLELDFDLVINHLQSGISEYFNVRLLPKDFSDEDKVVIQNTKKD